MEAKEPPIRITRMPIMRSVSTALFSTGSPASRPHGPGCSQTKSRLRVGARPARRPRSVSRNSPPQRTQMEAAEGKRPQSTVGSEPGAMPSHCVPAFGVSTKSSRCHSPSVGTSSSVVASARQAADRCAQARRGSRHTACHLRERNLRRQALGWLAQTPDPRRRPARSAAPIAFRGKLSPCQPPPILLCYPQSAPEATMRAHNGLPRMTHRLLAATGSRDSDECNLREQGGGRESAGRVAEWREKEAGRGTARRMSSSNGLVAAMRGVLGVAPGVAFGGRLVSAAGVSGCST
eukprot:scaffold180141_cov24-Tisochrysis_lutea.AAC.2